MPAFFFNASVYSYTFPSHTAFITSYKFGYVLFLFSFVPRHFLISFVFFFNPVVVQEWWFNFHIVLNFPFATYF